MPSAAVRLGRLGALCFSLCASVGENLRAADNSPSAVSANQVDATGVAAETSAIAFEQAAGPCEPCAPIVPVCVSLPRPQDELWLVDSRGLGCGRPEVLATTLRYWRLDTGRKWAASSLEEYLAADDSSKPTTVFIHGNRIGSGEANTTGWEVYRRFALAAPAERPIRLVIWSWPSDRIAGRQVDDIRAKAARCTAQAYYLAAFLDQLDPHKQVTLCGYSFGARIATGALHLLGGGDLDGHRLASRVHPERRSMDAVLLASASDNDWLLPGHYHGKALSQVNRMLIVNNQCDIVLRQYHRMYCRHGGPDALGSTGLVGANLPGESREKIVQADACCEVGRRHDWRRYFASANLVRMMEPYVLFEPAKAAGTAAIARH